VNDVSPVPPEVVFNVPARVTTPVVAVDGVKPPKEVWNERTGAEVAFDANNFTVPALFLKYSFSSTMLIANSPFVRLPEVGTAAAVVLKYRDMGVKPACAIRMFPQKCLWWQ
jgi:hypothetical protein